MTMRRPDGHEAWGWLTEGINAKTLIIACIAVIGSYYAQGSRITVVEQRAPEIVKRLDLDDAALHGKVDKDQYSLDQQRIQAELAAIRASQDRIETVLMERGGNRER